MHEGGFGPTIKGVQLGMPMTLTELAGVGVQLASGSEFRIQISDIGQEGYLGLSFTKDGKELTGWEISGGSDEAKKEFSQYKTLGELFEAISKEGFSRADLQYDLCVINGKNRVSSFSFGKGVFEAGAMSTQEFAQALLNAYHLPDLQGERYDAGSRYETRYRGKNLTEGWEVLIDYAITVSPAIVPGGFN